MSQITKPDFHLVDYQVKNISQTPGVVLLSSPNAWGKYQWAREYFEQKPQLGYFIWVKKSQKNSLFSCISLETAGVKQRVSNLIVIDPKVRVELQSVCNALSPGLSAIHQGRSKVVMKDSSFLKIFHQHTWGRGDTVSAQIDFLLDKQASLNYVYKNLSSPKKLTVENGVYLRGDAKADSQIIMEAKKSKIEINEALFLKGKNSGGSLVLRLVGREGADVKATSKIVAQSAGRGHLDCQGLLVDNKTKISLVPQLINKNKQALITHEASIGRIEKEKLDYLQSRGLNEEKAIDLLVKGFLGKEN